jgi:predicted nucleotidyltransferase
MRANYPNRFWIQNQLRYPLCGPAFRRRILNAFVIGSEARGLAKPGSDLDIAVVIPPIRGVDSLKLSERYHQHMAGDHCVPEWEGRKVDFQFFYPTDPELEQYQKIPI